MFCGEPINPRNWGIFPVRESQEPGIGISFKKHAGTRRIGSDFTKQGSIRRWENVEFTTYFVFARLQTPATVCITGTGQRIPITSLEIFDNALEEGFRGYHIKRERHESEIPYSGDYGE